MNLSTRKLLFNALALFFMNNASAMDVQYFQDFQAVQAEAQEQYEAFRSLVDEYNEGLKQNIEMVPRTKLNQATADFNQIRRPLILKYSWAIPNLEALNEIKSFSPIFELGAGSGYWAKLLKDLGADIVAVDNGSDSGTSLAPTKYWKKPIEGNESLVSQYPDRTLFLCWPDPRSAMASKALTQYKGKFFIYVGYPAAKRSPYMGDPEFYDMLDNQFELIKEVAIPQWPGYEDALYVYERL
jgi:hypothetical protein